MALSFCSNWGTMEHLIGPDFGSPLHHPAAGGGDSTLDASHLPILDHLFFDDAPDDDFSSFLADPWTADYDHDHDLLPLSLLFPSFSDPSVASLPPDLLPGSTAADDLDFYPYPKRARSCNDMYFDTCPLGDPLLGAAMTTATTYAPQEFSPEFVFSSPATELSGFSVGSCDEKKTNGGGGGSPSAQSVAARERRKRISEKTQELGRLIPGGNKMNTAEMFQSAYKYVKFLQAQVGMLELMGSFDQDVVRDHHQIQRLLASPAVQEKLASEERCVVPLPMVEALEENHEIKSHPSISRDIASFIELTVGSSG